MKRTMAILAGLLLMALGAPATAQWSNDHHERGGPGGFEAPHSQRDQRPPPQPMRVAPPGPPSRPPWQNDSLGAGWSPQQNEVREGVTQRRFIPLGQAIESIRRRGPGRELDAGLESWNGQPAYRVRWAGPDGRRIDYIVNAESGAIMNVEGGR
jgi:hypothetical protein